MSLQGNKKLAKKRPGSEAEQNVEPLDLTTTRKTNCGVFLNGVDLELMVALNDNAAKKFKLKCGDANEPKQKHGKHVHWHFSVEIAETERAIRERMKLLLDDQNYEDAEA